MTVLWTACSSASTLYVLCYCCMRCRTVEGTATNDYINIQPSDSSILPSEGRPSLELAQEMTKKCFANKKKEFFYRVVFLGVYLYYLPLAKIICVTSVCVVRDMRKRAGRGRTERGRKVLRAVCAY